MGFGSQTMLCEAKQAAVVLKVSHTGWLRRLHSAGGMHSIEECQQDLLLAVHDRQSQRTTAAVSLINIKDSTCASSMHTAS